MPPPYPTPALGAARIWARRSRKLDVTSFVISLLAVAAYLSALIAQDGSVGGFLGIGIACVGVLLSRKYLWVGSGLVVLAGLTSAVLGTDPIAIWTIGVFTAFSVALRSRNGAILGSSIGVGMFFSLAIAEHRGLLNEVAFLAIATSFTAAAAGSALRSYQRYLQESEERALEAIAWRDAETHQRIAEERVRIARDLHDVVGHEIAVMGIHLGVIEVNVDASNTAAHTAIDSARRSVQSVLLETQRILRVLRTDESEADALDGSLPTADFGRIGDLVERFRDAGVTVNAQLCETPPALDPTVSTAAYRLVQESLTNAQKYGVGAVSLRTEIINRMLVITTTNDVAPLAATPHKNPAEPRRHGFGLVGMRERALSAGGQLDINNTPTTFRVTAKLNLDGSSI